MVILKFLSIIYIPIPIFIPLSIINPCFWNNLVLKVELWNCLCIVETFSRVVASPLFHCTLTCCIGSSWCCTILPSKFSREIKPKFALEVHVAILSQPDQSPQLILIVKHQKQNVCEMIQEVVDNKPLSTLNRVLIAPSVTL